SGLPVIFDAVHGTRLSAAGPAADGVSVRTAIHTRAAVGRTARARRGRRFMRPTKSVTGEGRAIVPDPAGPGKSVRILFGGAGDCNGKGVSPVRLSGAVVIAEPHAPSSEDSRSGPGALPTRVSLPPP